MTDFTAEDGASSVQLSAFHKVKKYNQKKS